MNRQEFLEDAARRVESSCPAAAAVLRHDALGAAMAERLDVLEGELKMVTEFISAYDAWALSPELCGGPLFDAMLEARGVLMEKATALILK